MKVKKINLFAIALTLAIFGCSNESMEDIQNLKTDSADLELKLKKATTWEEQIAILDQKMQRFHNFQVALAQGYTELTGPPPFLGGPYVANMGYHYENPNYVDGEFNLLEPEILVYYPDENGNMIFGAAEYLVRIEGFNPPDCPIPDDSVAPEGFIGDADVWAPNCGAGGWTLHAWVGTENPMGVFHHTNPLVPESDVSMD